MAVARQEAEHGVGVDVLLPAGQLELPARPLRLAHLPVGRTAAFRCDKRNTALILAVRHQKDYVGSIITTGVPHTGVLMRNDGAHARKDSDKQFLKRCKTPYLTVHRVHRGAARAGSFDHS